MKESRLSQIFLMGLVLMMIGCARQPSVALEARPSTFLPEATKIGYTLQFGAFSQVDNAVRLTQALIDQNLDAFYFKHDSGLYKVQFGDFATRQKAKEKAESLKASGIITEYFIVSPESQPVSQSPHSGLDFIREQIVNRAFSFLGLPYRWGGTRPEEGFDCSGLTMAVYHLVGLNLPHSSHSQYIGGNPVSRKDLKKGDLVFFRSSREGRISHVGIYTGNGDFVHAPGKNQSIRVDSLSDRYFQHRFAGARTYISRLSRDQTQKNSKN
jgi:cell wall-associated NlpC family hydrolase